MPVLNQEILINPELSHACINPLCTRKPLTGPLAYNSEVPDEMQHNAAFHQGLHCLLRQNQS